MKHTRSECPSQENIRGKPRNVPNSRKLPLLCLVVFVVMIMSHVGVQKPTRKHCHASQKFSRQYRFTWSICHKFLFKDTTSRNCWDTFQSACPLNVGVQDMVTKLRLTTLRGRRGARKGKKNSVQLKCPNYFCLVV